MTSIGVNTGAVLRESWRRPLQPEPISSPPVSIALLAAALLVRDGYFDQAGLESRKQPVCAKVVIVLQMVRHGNAMFLPRLANLSTRFVVFRRARYADARHTAAARAFFHKTRSTSWLLLRSAGNWLPPIPFARHPHGASR